MKPLDITKLKLVHKMTLLCFTFFKKRKKEKKKRRKNKPMALTSAMTSERAKRNREND
jgi:hypothetical protein